MKLFWMISLIMHQPFDLERSNSAGYHRWVKDVRFFLHAHILKGRSPAPSIFGTPIDAHTVWPKATKFRMVTPVREGRVLGV